MAVELLFKTAPDIVERGKAEGGKLDLVEYQLASVSDEGIHACQQLEQKHSTCPNVSLIRDLAGVAVIVVLLRRCVFVYLFVAGFQEGTAALVRLFIGNGVVDDPLGLRSLRAGLVGILVEAGLIGG